MVHKGGKWRKNYRQSANTFNDVNKKSALYLLRCKTKNKLANKETRKLIIRAACLTSSAYANSPPIVAFCSSELIKLALVRENGLVFCIPPFNKKNFLHGKLVIPNIFRNPDFYQVNKTAKNQSEKYK